QHGKSSGWRAGRHDFAGRQMQVAGGFLASPGFTPFGKRERDCFPPAWAYGLSIMGLTKVTTKLTALQDPQQSYESLFLVDTGATDSMAPADELQRLGVKAEGRTSYELADGTVREFSFGLVRIEFMGETTAGRVIFAAPGTEPLLGVTALESVGIMVDPANKTLKRLPAIPLK
ncbi:MAG: clan AA aspartic protease, partial [Acidobacteria bacterium]|nr:clan AA aspartic protease [Acidobacteriota bacterium]